MLFWVAFWGVLLPLIGVFQMWRMLKVAQNIQLNADKKTTTYPTLADINAIESRLNKRIDGLLDEIGGTQFNIKFTEEDLKAFRVMIVSTIDGKIGNYFKQGYKEVGEATKEAQMEQFKTDPFGAILRLGAEKLFNRGE